MARNYKELQAKMNPADVAENKQCSIREIELCGTPKSSAMSACVSCLAFLKFIQRHPLQLFAHTPTSGYVPEHTS